MAQIDIAYNAKKVEDALYKKWEKSGGFTPKIDPKKKPFTISLPPPNATGQLHLGHATMLAIEDIMIRFHRMKGLPTLWLPGTDHAAIATQNKVEKIIAEEGTNRHEMGRHKFLERVKKYVANSQDTIRNQMRKMGASVDWTRERYTLDDGLSEAVSNAFVKMHKDGLIYRGHRIVNWCPRCASTLADEELEYKEQKTKFYYLKYGPVVIGTARPETKFQDKIIIVHPKDKRYKKWIGKKMMVPWIDGEVEAQFVGDETADMKMGTGAMTITPAHSFVDFDLAKKYGFEIVQIIDEQGKITSAGGPHFQGLPVKEAREKVIEALAQKGLVDHIDENYVHNLSVCYRCGTAVEPLVSRQWFVNVTKKIRGKSLKDRTLEAVKNGKIKIVPDRFKKVYFHWVENLRDWCISRQIWWGHQIPVWYCEDKKSPKCEEPIVGSKAPEKCTHCKGKNLKQDPDTLDTWFSSGLWTFSTLGWPKKTKDLAYFHPTSVLETGYDILFFWVIRMVLMTTYLTNEIPFETVYLHGLVRDKEGRKMSKSLGNGIDPLDMIEKYGTDAVRLSLVLGSSPGNDMRLYEEKIAGYRNFVNKIWNGARYVLMNLDKKDFEAKIDLKTLTDADAWILTRTTEVIEAATKGLNAHHLSESGTLIYDFFWSEFCDWYVEISKVSPNKPVLAYVLKTILTLLHPFTPFVTEELWDRVGMDGLLMVAPWPKANPRYKLPKSKKAMQKVMAVVSAIRKMRADYKVEPGKRIKAVLYGHAHTPALNRNRILIEQLARVENLTIEEGVSRNELKKGWDVDDERIACAPGATDEDVASLRQGEARGRKPRGAIGCAHHSLGDFVKRPQEGKKIKGALSEFVESVEIHLPLAGLVDVEREKTRLIEEIKNVEVYLKGLEAKLNNKGYIAHAPAMIVEQDKTRHQEAGERLKNLRGQLKELT